MYIIETFDAYSKSLFSTINVTDGSYLNARFLVDQVTECFQMKEYEQSLFILCEISDNILLEYSKTAHTLSSLYTFSSDYDLKDMVDVYNHGNSNNILFVGRYVSSPSAYI